MRGTSLLRMLAAAASIHAAHAAELEGTVEYGSGYLSNDAFQYGTYTGVNDQGLVPFLDFSLQSRPEPASGSVGYWRMEGERLGLATGRFALEAGEQGSQRLRVYYRGIPTYQYNDAVTPLRGGSGTTTLSLPQGWQANTATTAGMTTLDSSLTDVDLSRKRKSLTLDYRRTLGPQWTLQADFRHDRVEGTRALGGLTGASGGNARAMLLPAPVDYQTRVAALGIAFAGTALRWNLGYQGSFFDNGATRLTWPTAFAQHPQWAAGTGYPDGINQLALEPDNHSHQVNLNGSLALGGSKRLFLDASRALLDQNEGFLPYTLNPRLDIGTPLPMDALDARVATTRVNLRLTSRPLPRLNLVTRLGWRERDNQTPVAAYQRVPGDAVHQQDISAARVNRPYGLRESKAAIDAAWRLSSSLRVEGGYAYTETERNYSEVNRMDEHGVTLGLRSSGFDSLALALDFHHQRRRADAYVGNRPLLETRLPGSVDAEDFENHPLLRKYYLADRDRDQWRLHADWYLLTQLTLGAALAHSSDDYPTGYLGLQRSDVLSTTLDVTWLAGDELRLTGFLNRERYRNDQAGRSFRGSVPADAFDPLRNWQVAATDRFNTVGLSLDREQLRPALGDWQAAGQLDLALELSYSRSQGDIDTRVAAALSTAPLPALSTRLTSATLSARYHFSARASLRLALAREHYRSADFALDDVAPDSVASVLLMGQRSPDYQATWTSLSYRYQY